MNRDRRALVTGASSGIGLATAQALLSEDYQVTGISRRGRVDSLAGDNFHPLELDLGDLANVETKLGGVMREQRFDCFVHAAGRGDFGSIEQFSRTQIEDSMRVNLLSAMILCRALLPGMRREGGGHIIFIGSESALQAGRKGALYSAAKFGLRGFSQALREDCASDGVRVSLVNPGMVRSPFFDGLSFAPGALAENAIGVDDVAAVILQILQSSADIVIDEINLSPRVKSIDFKSGPR